MISRSQSLTFTRKIICQKSLVLILRGHATGTEPWPKKFRILRVWQSILRVSDLASVKSVWKSPGHSILIYRHWNAGFIALYKWADSCRLIIPTMAASIVSAIPLKSDALSSTYAFMRIYIISNIPGVFPCNTLCQLEFSSIGMGSEGYRIY